MDDRLKEFVGGSTATLYGLEGDRPRSFGSIIRDTALAGAAVAVLVGSAVELRSMGPGAPAPHQVITTADVGTPATGPSCAWIGELGRSTVSDAEVMKDVAGIANASGLFAHPVTLESRQQALGVLEDICTVADPVNAPRQARLGQYL